MATPQAEAVIETRGLRRVFKSRQREVEAVAGVDLIVRRGEIFGFLGPNGAGKTTTLRMLATLLPPSGGTARVAGCELATRPARIIRALVAASSRVGVVNPAVDETPFMPMNAMSTCICSMERSAMGPTSARVDSLTAPPVRIRRG